MDNIKYGEKYYIQCPNCKKMIGFHDICECGYSKIKDRLEELQTVIECPTCESKNINKTYEGCGCKECGTRYISEESYREEVEMYKKIKEEK